MATRARKDGRPGPRLSAEAKRLRDRLAESQLPGDTSLEPERLAEAAAFVLEAANQRADGEAAVLIRSALGERRLTRIAVVNPDMPFLVDSIASTVAAQGLAVDVLLHPVVPVRRNAAGSLITLPLATPTRHSNR